MLNFIICMAFLLLACSLQDTGGAMWWTYMALFLVFAVSGGLFSLPGTLSTDERKSQEAEEEEARHKPVEFERLDITQNEY